MLKGKRVILRPIELQDLPNYMRWFADTDVLEFFGLFRPINLSQEQAWYERQNGDPDSVNFAVELDGRHTGGAGLHLQDRKNQSAEVGLYIGEKELAEWALARHACYEHSAS